jgi:hypothetical protein
LVEHDGSAVGGGSRDRVLFLLTCLHEGCRKVERLCREERTRRKSVLRRDRQQGASKIASSKGLY